jgi:hypothetical protein
VAHPILLGSIVWVEVNEPTGTPAGTHPAIVVSRQEEIDRGDDLSLVVCSTSFSMPLQSGWFPVPTKPGPDGHPVTGLKEACVAKATWTQTRPQAKVLSVAGRAPMSLCRQIINWLNEENAKRLRKQREIGS